MSVQLKKDPLVIVPYSLFTLTLLVLVGLGKVTWVQFLAGIAALNVPALFGLTKGDESSKSDPPKPPNAVLGLVLAVGLVAPTSACASTASKKAAAEASYTGQLLECVEKHDAAAEADRCRDEVKAAWSAKDGGAEQ